MVNYGVLHHPDAPLLLKRDFLRQNCFFFEDILQQNCWKISFILISKIECLSLYNCRIILSPYIKMKFIIFQTPMLSVLFITYCLSHDLFLFLIETIIFHAPLIPLPHMHTMLLQRHRRAHTLSLSQWNPLLSLHHWFSLSLSLSLSSPSWLYSLLCTLSNSCSLSLIHSFLCTIWLMFSLSLSHILSCCVQVAKRKEKLLNYMLFLRITPTLPNTFINLASPIVDIPFHVFFLATLVGLIPSSYITVRVSFIILIIPLLLFFWSQLR